MMTIVFWNTNRQSVDEKVALLARAHNADLVLLAEHGGQHYPTLDSLNRDVVFPFQYASGLSPGFAIFSRFSPSFLIPRFDGHRVSIRTLALPARVEVTIAIAHMPSKLHETSDDQSFEFAGLARDIRKVEEARGHSRTILIGDLNANPFESGIVSAGGLNATMSRDIAARRSRIVKRNEYPFFYNPMWQHLGDARGKVCGTYYYDAGTHLNYYWNVFDQVLVRPDLFGFLPDVPVDVVSEIGSERFVTDAGKPDKKNASDHLPIVFRLDI